MYIKCTFVRIRLYKYTYIFAAAKIDTTLLNGYSKMFKNF